MEHQLHLLGGRAHTELAQKIADELGVELSPVKLDNFADGEISCRIGESVRGDDVFVFQTHASNVNDAVMEQAIMIDAAKRASASSITAVCPYLGYARQDRKSNGREPISVRLVVDILSAAGADRIMSVDLHSGQTQGFFDGPFDHLIARPILVDYMTKNFSSKGLVIVSPDAGRVKVAERYGSDLGCDIAIVHKQRSKVKNNYVEAKYLIGNVKNKTCVVIDDMIDTAGTICAAADLLAEHGAKEVYGMTTHGLFSGPAIERIEKSAFKKIIVTDTLPQDKKKSKKIEVLTIAPLIASAISAVYTRDSVSQIFDGQNQF
ncbi:ribose-phosphate diphosphokinase [Candidatus Saccharibacteria bacterium]|nr:ribose-phosphate diphosphokinase [Candidatus Saccharibacteria bacterium]